MVYLRTILLISFLVLSSGLSDVDSLSEPNSKPKEVLGNAEYHHVEIGGIEFFCGWSASERPHLELFYTMHMADIANERNANERD